MSQTDENCSDDIIKILVATDNHLGYKEKDKIRGNDTFDTFEEILQIAKNEDVDFILLGGDLFHESNPSPYSLFKCLQLIRTYCFGEKPVEIEFLSEQSENFKHLKNPIVNYEDPNLNVSIPIFSIHGNHDDITGYKQISPMDLMSVTGALNYFGRYNDVANVEVTPILLQKGTTKLALYGLSHIPDERLARIILDKKFIMKTPMDSEEWFNIFVLHQNRSNRGAKKFIPESSIPDFIDLVIWCHEHDCHITAISSDRKVFFSQPGSSVATSLSYGESIPKHIGLLKIKNREFDLKAIPLTTVRPFVFDEINLTDKFIDNQEETILEKLTERIESMIEKSKTLGRKPNLLPLIHLNVYYIDDKQCCNPIRFSQTFANQVANPDEILKFKSIKSVSKERRTKTKLNDINLEEDNINKIEDYILEYFKENSLNILSSYKLTNTVKKYSESSDKESILKEISIRVDNVIKELNTADVEEEGLDQFLKEYKRKADEKERNSIFELNLQENNNLNDSMSSKEL